MRNIYLKANIRIEEVVVIHLEANRSFFLLFCEYFCANWSEYSEAKWTE
jgi:hypothetical protein